MDAVDFVLIGIGIVVALAGLVIQLFLATPLATAIVMSLFAGVVAHQVSAYSLVTYAVLTRNREEHREKPQE
jgi:hypothetical protein